LKKLIAIALLAILAACHGGPALEDDARYVKLAKVVDVHVYTDAERKAARASDGSRSRVHIGIGIGIGTGGFDDGYDGWIFGGGGMFGDDYYRREPPRVEYGANRYTVETVGKGERIEVLSYAKYKVGDCVKVLTGHPTEYARLFSTKPGEHCDSANNGQPAHE
jgi:hypothetical protein